LGAPFVERVHGDLDPPAIDSVLADESLLVILATLLNDRRLFETVRAVTGCDPIACFHPVIYRFDPRPEHHDAWHGDNDGNRLVAMSINIGGPFDGGVLQFREGPKGRQGLCCTRRPIQWPVTRFSSASVLAWSTGSPP